MFCAFCLFAAPKKPAAPDRSAAAAGIATINSLGNLGGFVGPFMIGLIKQQTGSYTWGLWFVAGLLILSSLVVLWLSASSRKAQANEPLIQSKH